MNAESRRHTSEGGTAHPDGVVMEVRNLTKRFPIGNALKPKYVHALNDVSFTIKRGEVIALVGESGSGKSTTARLIARLMPPTKGEIIFKGRNVLKTEPRKASLEYRSDVQMIFQDPFGSLNPVHTIGYHLERPLLIHTKARGATMQDQVLDLLTTVGLNPARDYAAKFPHQLSGGQRQRVAIARALAVDPEVMLADEPISMLDVSIRISLLDLLHGLATEFQVATVLITHDLAVARYFARKGRIAVMYLGRVVELGDTESLVADPAHPYSTALIAAIPEADPTITRTKARVPLRSAEIPSLLNVPPGCNFHPRCPLFEAGLCDVKIPELGDLPGGRSVACHVALRERQPAAELLGVR